MKLASWTIFLILLVDQIVKIWIKTTMVIGEEIHVFGDWFIIHFTENNGMAFGLQIAGDWGKLILSLFRVVAIVVIAIYLYNIIKKQEKRGFIFSISLILAGAIGNMIDSAFYGLIFSESYQGLAQFFPAEGGYSSFLHGHVVDMFYFPVVKGSYPDWLPFLGGDRFIFFRPVFNIADSAITVGVFVLIFFQKSLFPEKVAPQLNQDN
ncbi:MAG: lipoprotein signal peptidase [Bacteroidota bacterium]|nr:lipoprotein signal peptidase [Bacteroidota bacterium]